MVRNMGRMVLGVLAAAVIGQAAPGDSLWVPVTFYDFHSDGSNPEFQCAHTGAIRRNMVDSVLDADNKPTPGSSPYLNYYIASWFRDWNKPGHVGCKGDSTIPIYTRTDTNPDVWDAVIRYDGIDTIATDTSFKNKVIRDSLLFTRQPGLRYLYDNQAFFKLDGHGFGNEAFNHNFSFTMELHKQFTFHPGQAFEFVGDDDVWVFINGKLALDLGGIHPAAYGDFTLDTTMAAKFGLIEGNVYNLDFFYAERHDWESHIRITTDIIQTTPVKLELSARDTSVQAGESVDIKGMIFDQNDALCPNLLSYLTWSILPNTKHPGDSIKGITFTDSASVCAFTAREAFHDVIIQAKFVNPYNLTQILTREARINVLPGEPTNSRIERASMSALTDSALVDLFDSTKAAMPLDTIVMTQTPLYAYAISRDRFGNFTGLTNSTAWLSLNQMIFTAEATLGKSYETVLTPLARGSGTLVVTAPGLESDSVRVTVESVPISKLRLESGAATPIDSLVIDVGADTAVHLMAQRADNGVWQEMEGSWKLSDSLRLVPPLPGSRAHAVTFVALDTGTTKLTASIGELSVTIPIRVLPGLKAKEASARRISRMSVTVNNSRILCSVPGAGRVELDLLDCRGRRLSHHEFMAKGAGTYVFAPVDEHLSAGTYFIRYRMAGRDGIMRVAVSL